MNFWKVWLCLLLLGLGAQSVKAQEQGGTQAHPLRVFIIGNSFSQNARRYLPEMAKAGGHSLVLGLAEAPGRSLRQHWEAVETAEKNPADPAGQLYKGQTLRQLLSQSTWDIVTIQQASVYSSDSETYRPYAQKLRDFIRSIQPNAEVVMHQTWFYRDDSKQFGFLHAARGERTQTSAQMWQMSHAAYRTIAGELGVRVIPVGDAFWFASRDSRWGYKPDATFDFTRATPPNLPDQAHSLHAGYSWQNGQLNFDGNNHASDAGCYLGGLMWYGFLFHESPTKLSFVPPEVEPTFASYLRHIAAQTLLENGPL